MVGVLGVVERVLVPLVAGLPAAALALGADAAEVVGGLQSLMIRRTFLRPSLGWQNWATKRSALSRKPVGRPSAIVSIIFASSLSAFERPTSWWTMSKPRRLGKA
ncbi:MAG: hypothetical protein GEV08_19660 [Acidimicrobiia bacterium]|nr:hypothetical protein [Acidimicrobiia bacterium]